MDFRSLKVELEKLGGWINGNLDHPALIVANGKIYEIISVGSGYPTILQTKECIDLEAIEKQILEQVFGPEEEDVEWT